MWAPFKDMWISSGFCLLNDILKKMGRNRSETIPYVIYLKQCYCSVLSRFGRISGLKMDCMERVTCLPKRGGSTVCIVCTRRSWGSFLKMMKRCLSPLSPFRSISVWFSVIHLTASLLRLGHSVCAANEGGGSKWKGCSDGDH